MEDFAQAGGPAPTVDGYDVGRFLGRGGDATVWLVNERATGAEYALKCFHPGSGPVGGGGSGQATETIEAMRREVRILAALEHEHLLRSHAVLRLAAPAAGPDVHDELALLLEYAAGGALADVVAGRGTLTAGETVTVLTPIAQALAYLHARGVTHGDVSPGNVLFTAQGKPLLADLGVGRMVGDAGAGTEAGTDGFRDPSPVDAVRAGLQPERDVYSLAAIGWYCLAGRPPAPGSHRPPLPFLVPDVPASLAAALEAGLNEDRRLRPTAGELAAAVYRSAAAEAVDLSLTAHPTVAPQLLTRRASPASARPGRMGRTGRCFPSGRPAKGARSGAHQRTADGGTGRHAAGTGGARHLAPEAGPGPGARRETAAPSGRHSVPALGLRRDGQPRSNRNPRGGTYAAGRRRDTARAGAAMVALLAVLGVGAVVSAVLRPAVTEQPTAGTTAQTAEPATAQATAQATEQSAGAGADPAAAVVPRELGEQLESADPADAVRGLAALRAQAFSTGNFALLDQVNAPSSPAADADGRIAAELAATGHVLAGFSTGLMSVRNTPDRAPGRAVVAVSAASEPYQERDAAGSVLAEAPAGQETRVRLVLTVVGGRWKIAEILPSGPWDAAE
ncbi:serine/threonine-protein kinase [Arthrobacter sp. PM3]|uniref:serine/threonine-protein kinase n=1 Tax=Arthrobacter sp. PM3 TaxID=2017685 RepID=UPI000E10057A|nr:serine/threonine-protein kinase [Arthrobacter sp. PM3]AXJ10771.1 serine/threonine protein kinase [Arthrobacter sp. PM3]